MRKIYIKTLGCEKNTVDSECAMGIAGSCACKVIGDPMKADFLMVVTCGFILDAKQQSIESILELASIKTDRQKLIVAGCLSQRYVKDLLKSLPEVDYFLGVDDYKRLPEILANGQEASADRNLVGKCSKDFIELPRKINNSYSACIKIAEGCNNICSYCAIPFMRGKYRSRKKEDILAEAKLLAANGVKELLVIAQDVTFYGKDLKQKYEIADLLHDLCKIRGIKWIRILYCYEDEISDSLIDCIKSEKKICKYIDIPIQHCSDKILKSMNRKSTHASIVATVEKLRKNIPGIVIRTTLITGLPGETKKEFNELYDFVKDVKFDRLGAFAYSKEEGTKAAKMPNQVSKTAKERRRDKIMELQKNISLLHNESLIGKKLEVIVDEKDGKNIYIGRSYMDAPEIDNSIIFTSKKKLMPGDFVKVLITDGFEYDICGEVVE